VLSGDAARAALEQYAAPEDARRAGIRRHGLLGPRLAAAVAQAMRDASRSWRPVAEKLDQLDSRSRERVMTALAPELGSDLARWWEWSSGQPYQRGWLRRAYRSSVRGDSLEARWTELRQFLSHAVTYPQPLQWHAEWALHLGDYVPLGGLFASAIADGDVAVAQVLQASVRGEHDISGPSRNAFIGLLSAPDPAGWSEIERLLVAAQRSEGLRQAVLESADLAHPQAFARILDLAVEHRMARFAATVRAVGVWVGEDLTVRRERDVAEAIGTIRDHLRVPPTAEALADADPVTTFLGVWSLAVTDVHEAVPLAESLLDDRDERTRLAAARLLTDFAVPACGPGLTRAVADPALPVYAAAVAAWPVQAYGPAHAAVPLPDAARSVLHDRVATLGRVQDVETGLIGSTQRKVGGSLAADVLVCHAGDRPLDADLVAAASADGRWVGARAYADDPQAHRDVLFSLVADRSTHVRGTVAGALQTLGAISEDEARLLEDALRLKAADLRTTALSLLQQQDAAAVAASVERLGAGTAEQRRAAEELGGVAEAGDEEPDLPPAGVRFTAEERTPSVRPPAPDARDWVQYHHGARLAWTSLGAWLDEHADVEVRTASGVGLLSNVRWVHTTKNGGLPIPEVLAPWWERTAPQLTEGGVELALLGHVPRTNTRWATDLARTVVGPVADRLPEVDAFSLRWSVVRAVATHACRDTWAGPLLRFAQAAAAALPLDSLSGPAEVLARRGRRLERDRWGNVVSTDGRGHFSDLFAGSPGLVDLATLDDDEVARLWWLARFVDEPEGCLDRWSGPTVEVEVRSGYGQATGTASVLDQPQRWPVEPRLVVEAFTRGAATRADLLDALVLPSGRSPSFGRRPRQGACRALTGLRPEPWAAHEDVQRVVAELRDAVILAETTRGDLPGVLSETSHELRTTYGAEQLVACVAALGRRPFARAYAWSHTRESSLSHLVRANQPLPDDTAADLGRMAAQAGVSNERLVETAVYAPQWARLVEEQLGWPGLESAVWWVHAHTKDDSWTVDAEIRAQWATEVSQRTPLDAEDLVRGAADVAWFHEVVTTLGRGRFGEVLKAAKYASSSGGHTRARLFATALLGEADESALLERIRTKRHQDSVRALGLLPLDREAALLERYELLRAFVASDRTSGSQRRASETAAVAVGLDNLARTAGYRDPQRLVWAMEAEAVRDLAAGPVTARDGDLEVALSIDPSGAPVLSVNRAGRVLKSVPAKSAKVPEVAELRDRATALRAQVRRMRASLEHACVLGDAFDEAELAGLLAHPVLAPMLRDLVLVDDEGLLGFPLGDGALAAPDGTRRAAAGSLRVAHPVDLLASGEWPELQHLVMSEERRQPFKQVFRELYAPSSGEVDEAGVASRRYAGHQLEGRRAGGIFTSRGWVADVEQGFSRTFHEQKVTAWCHLLEGWGSPTEVEDATVGDVTFHPAGTWRPLPLTEVPPRVFSEAMRDLDLVVSVAHSSGVDPEASESSVEVRGRLVDETATLLGLTAVEVSGHHARVKGALGTYSVHLGSGVVHRVPGNAVCIVPVSAQHRGRVFLPFADDDPRTAEVVAKVVLLARDDKITDPTILQQLVG
jgi:hypothetical protein